MISKQPQTPAARGFTLIELMTVIVIIVILMSVAVGGISFIKDRQNRSLALVQIHLLAKGIESYKLDVGNYPGVDQNTPLDGDVSEELYQALFLDGYNSHTSGDGSIEIYLPELDPRSGKQTWVEKTTAPAPPTAPQKIVDPWGNAYRYRKGDNAENPDFDLWSLGKDGLTDTSDPSMQNKVNGDDIRNF